MIHIFGICPDGRKFHFNITFYFVESCASSCFTHEIRDESMNGSQPVEHPPVIAIMCLRLRDRELFSVL